MGKYVADLPETTSYYFESTQIISLDIRAGKVRLIISDPCVAQGPKNIAGVRGPLGNCIPSVTDKPKSVIRAGVSTISNDRH